MYKNVKSKLIPNDGTSDYFECLSIFLNDLEDHLNNGGVNGINKEIISTQLSYISKVVYSVICRRYRNI